MSSFRILASLLIFASLARNSLSGCPVSRQDAKIRKDADRAIDCAVRLLMCLSCAKVSRQSAWLAESERQERRPAENAYPSSQYEISAFRTWSRALGCCRLACVVSKQG